MLLLVSFFTQTAGKIGKTRTSAGILHGKFHRFLRPDQNKQFLCPAHAGIDKITLEHDKVLGQYRHDNHRKFTALGFVDRYRILSLTQMEPTPSRSAELMP